MAKKIKIVRLKAGKPVQDEPVQEELEFTGTVSLNTKFPRINVTPQGVTVQTIRAGAIHTADIADSTVTNPNPITWSPGSIVGPTSIKLYDASKTGPETIKASKTKSKEIEFDQAILDTQKEWTTSEAAWHCGMTTSTWHVYMTKEDGIAPVTMGRGRGKQNRYLADDVRKYKERLDAKRKKG